MTAGDQAFEALRAAGAAAHARGDYRALESAARALTELGDRAEDRRALAWGCHYLGVVRLRANDGAAAKSAFLRAVELFEAAGDPLSASRGMMNLAMIELAINVDVAAARRFFDAAEPIVRGSGDPLRVARAAGNLGEIYRLEGDHRAALRAANESLAMFRELNDRARAAWQLTNVAHLHALLRDYPAALQALEQAYDELALDPNKRWVAWYFDVCFIIAARLDRWEIAAQLQGFVDRLRDEYGAVRSQVMLPWLSGPKERVASTFPEDRYEQLLREGEALSMEGARALVSSLRG